MGNVGRRIDVSTIELEFDLPSRLSHIEWSDENGAHEASIDLGDGKVKNWPYLHCVVMPFHKGWRCDGQARDLLEEEILSMNDSFGVAGTKCSVEQDGLKAMELLCKCSDAVNDLVRLDTMLGTSWNQ